MDGKESLEYIVKVERHRKVSFLLSLPVSTPLGHGESVSWGYSCYCHLEYWWRKCRIGAQGTEGFAETLTGGGWRSVIKTGSSAGPGSMSYDQDMPPYIQDMDDWLDDDERVHTCCFDSAYKGHEIMMALVRSAANSGQVALPLESGMDELTLLKQKLPNSRVLLLIEANSREYGG